LTPPFECFGVSDRRSKTEFVVTPQSRASGAWWLSNNLGI
jgi:hypothetical protein